MEPVAAYIREYRTNNRYTEHRTHCRVFGIASASETSHVDNLGNLEKNGNNNDIGNLNTYVNNMWFFRKEEPEEEFSTEQVYKSKYNGNGKSHKSAGGAIIFCKVRLLCAEAMADKGNCGSL